MHNTLLELLEQYKNQTGNVYRADHYPNPRVMSQSLLKLVVSIKVAAAEARQLEIVSEIRKNEKAGEVFIVKNEDLPLTKEYEHH